ncbi:DUF945 family protein [Vibrio sp.]|uniref:DUF945 family protein n=1 Tax=Vibrio sp. TaxID=678 RepID=UPI003D0BB428
MQQLKKIGAIGGVISLALCWPLAVGQIGERVIHDAIGQISSDSVKTEVVSYQRGYLSSQVTTRYIVNDPELIEQLEQDGLPTELTVVSNVSHGLFDLTAESHVRELDDMPLTLNTVTQLNGNTRFDVQLDSWNYADADGVTVSNTPISLTGETTVLGEISYQFDMPSLHLEFGNGEAMQVSGMTGVGEGKRLNNFWLGDQTVTLEQLTVIDEQLAEKMRISGVKYQFESSQNAANQRLDSRHVLDVAEFNSAQGQLTDINFDFSLGDLDAEAFSQLLSLYQNSGQLSEAEIQQAVPLLESLFAKGFYVSLNKMALKLGEGVFSSNINLRVPEGTDNVAQQPEKILPALTGSLESFISQQLVQQYPFIQQGIDEGIIMEMIRETERGYHIKADVENGHLRFENGPRIPIVSLMLPVVM